MSGPWEEFSSKMPWEEFTSVEEPQAPRSRWDVIKGAAQESYTEGNKKHKLWPLYQEYVSSLRARQDDVVSPKPGEIPFEPYKRGFNPMTFNQFKREHGDMISGVGHTIATGIDIGASLAGSTLDILTAPVKGLFYEGGMEEGMRHPYWEPNTEGGQATMKFLGENLPPILAHVPARVGSKAHNRYLKRLVDQTNLDVAAAEAEAAAKAKAKPQVSPQLELPLSTSPEAIAERQAVGSGQPDFFFSDQANIAARGDGALAEAAARSRAAQAAVEAQRAAAADAVIAARQAALEEQVARQGGEDAIAAQRQRTLAQGAADLARTETGYQAHQQRQLAAEVEAAGVRPLLQHQDVLDFTPHGDRPAQFGMTDTGGRMSEHGIPIRADLSMEAQHLQNPLQRNLWGDELPGRTGDGGLPLTRALDKMPPGPERTAALEQLGVPAMSPHGDVGRALGEQQSRARSGIGPGRVGPRGGITRGALDIKGVKEALEDFRKGFIPGHEALSAFRGTFSPVEMSMNIKESVSPTAQGRLVWMTPDDFHKAANPRLTDLSLTNPVGANKRQTIREALQTPSGLSEMPLLAIDETGKVEAHNGRHRMDIFKEKGIAKVPVMLSTRGHRNADGPLPFSMFVSENGKHLIATPEPIFPLKDPASWVPKTPVGQAGLGRGGMQRGGTDFGIVDRIREGFKDIEDITKTVQTFIAPKADAIISQSLAAGKDGKSWGLLEPGATMAAAKRNSPLIEGVSRVVQWYKAAAERSVRDFVFPFEKAARRLKPDEVVQLAGVLKREMFSGARIPMDKLVAAGFSEKTLLAYQRARDMFNEAYTQQNNKLIAAGKKPLTPLEAYLNSQWGGVHRQVFLNSEGKPVWVLAADSLPRLKSDAKALTKDFPNLQPQEPFMLTKSKMGTNLGDIYRTMMEVMGDDPAFQTVKQWYEARVASETSAALGQQKFFKDKINVRGFIGDRPLTGMRTEFTEARDLLQAQANYAKGAFHWSSLQDAGAALKDVFSNKELQQQQPSNMSYAKMYYMDQLGAGEARWVKALEDTINEKMPGGITSTWQIGRGINNLKAIWIAQKLAANLGYAGANVLQLPQALPHIADIVVKYGGNPIFGLVGGMTGGMMLVAQHQLNPTKVNLAKLFAGLNKETRDFFVTAMKYAEDNQVVLSSAADESPIAKSFGPLAGVKRVSDWTISFPDSLRGIAFMTYASQLHSTGKFDVPTSLRMAHEYTTNSMVDFRAGEGAVIFDRMGTIGNAANTLQKFSINYFQQWNWALRESGRGNVAPALTMLAVQGALGGAMGLPLFSTVDKTIELLKDWLRDHAPLQWAKVKDFSLKELVLHIGEGALYGGASMVTPLSMSSRVQAPAPEEMLQVPGAPIADAVHQGASVANAIMDPSIQNASQALYDIAPSGAKGLLETGPLKDQVSSPVGDTGSRIVRKPTKMDDPAGMFERTPSEAAVRALGIRAQSEVFKRYEAYRSHKQAADTQKVITELPKRMWNSFMTGDQDKGVQYIRLYAELHPELTGEQLSKTLENQIVQTFTTQDSRLVTTKPTVARLLAYKRFTEAMEAAGYSMKKE